MLGIYHHQLRDCELGCSGIPSPMLAKSVGQHIARKREVPS